MPHFQLFDLVRWFHFITLALGGGAAMTALMLSGLEEAQEEYRGLSAALWKKLVVWSIRLSFVAGLGLVAYLFKAGGCPFQARYMVFKPVLAILLMVCIEVTPKALARGRRGSALMAILLFLLISLVTFNGPAFGSFRAKGPDQLHALPESK